MLQRVWQEIEYRIGVCRVTQGAHIEHLWFTYSCGPNVCLSVSCFPVDQFLEFLLIPISCFPISLIQEQHVIYLILNIFISDGHIDDNF